MSGPTRSLQGPVRPALLPCPFCGHAARMDVSEHDGKNYYWIRCDDTSCRGYTHLGEPDQKRALDRWNRRDLSILREIKLTVLTMTRAQTGLSRILRLCIDAGVTEKLDQLQPNAKLSHPDPNS